MTQNVNQSLGKIKESALKVGKVAFRINKRTIHIYGIHCYPVVKTEKTDDFRKSR